MKPSFAHPMGPAAVLGFKLATTRAWTEEGLEHYIQVDLGTKWYDIQLHQNNAALRGQFTESVVVTPTARCRFRGKDTPLELVMTGGLSYGSFIADDLEVDTFEFHLGVGGAVEISPWAHLDIMASIGRGYTWVELPPTYRTRDNEFSTWGYSSHCEVVATLAVTWRGLLLSANAGYRYTGLTLTDPEHSDRSDEYSIHGFVVGGAIGFTF